MRSFVKIVLSFFLFLFILLSPSFFSVRALSGRSRSYFATSSERKSNGALHKTVDCCDTIETPVLWLGVIHNHHPTDRWILNQIEMWREGGGGVGKEKTHI